MFNTLVELLINRFECGDPWYLIRGTYHNCTQVRWWKSRHPTVGMSFRTAEAIDFNYFVWAAWVSPLANITWQRRCQKCLCFHLWCPAPSIARWQKQHILVSGRPKDDRHHSSCFFSHGSRRDTSWQEYSGSVGTKNATLSIWGTRHANSNLIEEVVYIYYVKISLALVWTPLSLGRALVLPAEHINSYDFSRGLPDNAMSAAG